jgi:type IV secretion system protein VirB9
MWKPLVLSLLTLSVHTACVLGGGEPPLPPALPEERVVLEPPPAAKPAVVQASPMLPPFAEDIPVQAQPVVTPTAAELSAFTDKGTARKTEKPETVIAQANSKSTISPSSQGYSGSKNSIQRYPYVPGMIYDVYSSPHHPTSIILPPGERMAETPAIRTDAWDINWLEMGQDDERQEVIIIRPLQAGYEGSMTLFTVSGMPFFLRLKSFEKTSMMAVTWDVPRRPRPIMSREQPASSATGRSVMGHGPFFRERPQASPPTSPPTPGPTVDPSRLHTAYAIQAVKGKPAWVPLAVYDDGTKTVIKFRESLKFTQAPGVFASDAEGNASLVQFTPYEVPGEADKGAYYIVLGLYPQLELKGSEGQVVRITRQTGQPKPYKEVKDAN